MPAIVVFSWVTSYAEVRAQTSENTHTENFRELCRRFISGVYADSYNENFRAQDAAKLAEQTTKRLVPQETKLNQDLAKVEKQLKAGNYDPALSERRDQLIAQIKLFHDQISAQEEAAQMSKKSADVAAKRYKSLEGDIKQIFEVHFADDPEGRPRKIFNQLTWKSVCPKFRSLCPLPQKEAVQLKALAKKAGDQDGDCLKYSAIK